MIKIKKPAELRVSEERGAAGVMSDNI